MRMKSTRLKRNIILVLVLLPALSGMPERVFAQDLVDGNSADLDDFRTSFRNPASLAFLPNQFVFGTKAFDVGINPGTFDLSNGYIGYYSPHRRKRLGLNGQFLRTGIFSVTSFGLSYSERLHPSIAVGGRLDVLNQGFDRDRFQGVDPGDPLLSSELSRNYYSIALGVLAMPTPELSIGAVAENVNRPNVALSEEEQFHLPVDYDIGVQYRADRLHPSFNLRYEDGAFRYRLRMGIVLTEDLMARLEYQRERLGFEGHIRLYRGLNLNYRYQYPLNELNTFSSGSHNLSFVYDFTRILEIPDLIDVRYTPEPVELSRSREAIPVEGDFIVFSSTPSLDIWEKNITRRVDDDIPLDFLKRNYHRIFAVEGLESTPGRDEIVAFSPDTSIGLVGSYSKEYRSTLDSLSAYLLEGDVDGTTIVSPENELLRAGNIKDVIIRKTEISPEKILIVREPPKQGGVGENMPPNKPAVVADTVTTPIGISTGTDTDPDSTVDQEVDLSLLNRTETRIDLSQESVQFQVIALNMESYDAPWSLVIHDSDGGKVREFTGSGSIPERIIWDWLDEGGTLVEPGWYSYRFRWTEPDGSSKDSMMGRLFVKKNKKNITIELTRKWLKKIPDAQRLEVLMNQ